MLRCSHRSIQTAGWRGASITVSRGVLYRPRLAVVGSRAPRGAERLTQPRSSKGEDGVAIAGRLISRPQALLLLASAGVASAVHARLTRRGHRGIAPSWRGGMQPKNKATWSRRVTRATREAGWPRLVGRAPRSRVKGTGRSFWHFGAATATSLGRQDCHPAGDVPLTCRFGAPLRGTRNLDIDSRLAKAVCIRIWTRPCIDRAPTYGSPPPSPSPPHARRSLIPSSSLLSPFCALFPPL